MKKQTLEEAALPFLPNSEVDHDTDFIIGFEFGAKWQQEQAKVMEEQGKVEFAFKAYSEMLSTGKSFVDIVNSMRTFK